MLSNPVILTYLWEHSCIIHTLTKTACLVYQFRSEKCLQCLKNEGLYNSFGIGRCSFWHSLLTQGSRLANSQASASNVGLPGDPNSPESNCSYLALILSIKELYSLCASCTVIKKMTDSNLNVISMSTLSIQPKHVFTQSNLRVNWSIDCETGKEAPKVSSCVIQGRCQQKSKS